jgi:protein SCO1/2
LVGLLAGCGSQDGAVDATGAANGRPAARGATFNGFPLGHPLPKPKVTLTDTAGKPYDIAARTRGKVTLFYYGFTHCDDTCPAVMAAIATAMRELPKKAAARVRVVFVTTDPARDSPKVLRRWLNKYGSANFVGLTGSKSELAKAYRRVGMPQPVKEPKPGGGYDVVHGADTYVYGLHNKARLADGPDIAPKEIAHDIRLLQAGHTPPKLSLAQLEESGANGSVGAVRIATAFIPQPQRGAASLVEMTLANTADTPDRLVSVRTSLGGKVKIVASSGRTVGHLALGATQSATGIRNLAASGTHLAVVGRDSDAPPLRTGQLVKVTLRFAHAGRGSITVPVVGPGGPGSS